MLTGLYDAGSGAQAFESLASDASTNAANVATPGYEAEVPEFASFLEGTLSREPDGAPIGTFSLGVQTEATLRTGTPGPIEATGRPLDFAPAAGVWIPVRTPGGIAYTRNGELQVGPTGMLMSGTGLPIVGTGGQPIQVGYAEGASLQPDGTVTSQGRVVGRIALVTQRGGSMLAASGTEGLFTPSPQAVMAQGGKGTPRALVGSNADLVTVAAQLDTALQGYDAAQTVARTDAQDFTAFVQQAVRS